MRRECRNLFEKEGDGVCVSWTREDGKRKGKESAGFGSREGILCFAVVTFVVLCVIGKKGGMVGPLTIV